MTRKVTGAKVWLSVGLEIDDGEKDPVDIGDEMGNAYELTYWIQLADALLFLAQLEQISKPFSVAEVAVDIKNWMEEEEKNV